MGERVQFRWLGVAGTEWSAGGRILAIDPFFSRPPFRRLWFGRAHPDERLCAELMPRCDVILVSHSHWDHLMDVPDIARRTGARVLGSPNSCALLALCGLPDRQIDCVSVGDHRIVRGFEIEVLPAIHPRTPIDHLVNGPLSPTLRPPLRLVGYRMDVCFSFRVHVAGQRVLSGDQPVSADVWVCSPLSVRTNSASLLRAICPRLVMPIHWDNLFRPLNRGTRRMLARPACEWPPLRALDVSHFLREIEAFAPGTRTFVSKALHAYSLEALVAGTDLGRAGDGRS